MVKLHTKILLAFLLCTTISLSAQDEIADSVVQQGINFIDAEWGEVLALAELEGKSIFLDAYTSWCRPCKVMDTEVFSRPDVGTLFNDNFLNVKMNMETGIGVKLAKQYQIIAYPTLLFVNYDGTIVHRFSGYQGPGDFLQLGREALDEENNFAAMQKRYQDGERSTSFLKKYLTASMEARDPNQSQVLEAYLNSLPDQNTEETRSLIFSNLDTPTSPLFDFLIANKPAFIEQFGQSKVENQIQSLVSFFLQNDPQPLVAADTIFKKAYPERGEQLATSYKINHYVAKEDGQNYAKVIKNYLTNNDTDQELLNEIAWNYYDLVEDEEDLNHLFAIVKQAKKADPSYLNLESLALLYAKCGKIRKAKKFLKKAIALATAAKTSPSSAEELLEEIQTK